MGNIIFIRHGESMGNIDSQNYSLPDSAVCLTTTGVYQAVACGKYIKTWGKTHGLSRVHAFCSEFTRAQQTAKIVCDLLGHTGNITITPYLNERHYGTGKPEGNHTRDDLHSDWYARPVNGESLEMAGKRLETWFDREATPLSESGVVIVFTHGQVMKYIMTRFMGIHHDAIKPPKVPSKNACPYIMGDYTEGHTILTLPKYQEALDRII